jgi:uncharacterized protein YukE
MTKTAEEVIAEILLKEIEANLDEGISIGELARRQANILSESVGVTVESGDVVAEWIQHAAELSDDLIQVEHKLSQVEDLVKDAEKIADASTKIKTRPRVSYEKLVKILET